MVNALRSYATQHDRLHHLQNSLASYQHAVAAAKRENNEGVISRVELLSAREREVDAQLLLNQAQTALRLNVVAVYRSLGIGFGRDIAISNGNDEEVAGL